MSLSLPVIKLNGRFIELCAFVYGEVCLRDKKNEREPENMEKMKLNPNKNSNAIGKMAHNKT